MPHRGQEKGTSAVYTTYARILLGWYLMHWDQSIASNVMRIHAGGAPHILGSESHDRSVSSHG